MKKAKDDVNRFLKFYHKNKDKLSEQRKEDYHEKQEKGTCVRCKQQAVKGVYCEYHHRKSLEYNQKYRRKNRYV
jgi:hypothetical protein